MEADGSFDEDDIERWRAHARQRREVVVLTMIGVVLILVFGPLTYARSWINDPVYDAVVVAPTDLALHVGSCGLDRRVDVEETDATIEVLVRYRRTRAVNDCVESVTAMLRSPLGNRRVVDVATGESILICPSLDAPWSACERR